MTGLQVWLHPSSRTLTTVVGLWSFVVGYPAFAFANDLTTKDKRHFLHSSTLWWTAAVVRDRRGVFYVAHFDAGSRQRADGRFTAGTWAAYSHLDTAHAVIAR